ncbi:hypothetical protein ACFU99_23350 [Streptomyces sp. NPDC057654]|uniref:hypothetical protein n=1 Tax=Streptomyces sp. NPDC057654 TaxID=3346196 RepID=UPI003683A418
MSLAPAEHTARGWAPALGGAVQEISRTQLSLSYTRRWPGEMTDPYLGRAVAAIGDLLTAYQAAATGQTPATADRLHTLATEVWTALDRVEGARETTRRRPATAARQAAREAFDRGRREQRRRDR